MSFSVKVCRSTLAAVLASAITLGPVAPAFGQNAPPAGQQAPAPSAPAGQQPGAGPETPGGPYKISRGPNYSIAPQWFPHALTPYFPIQVPQPELGNTPRIQQMIHDGKLQLSLQDAIALGLENNLDILVNRYYAWMAETDVLRARGGGAQRGVNIVQVPTAFADVPTLSFDPLVTSTLSVDSKDIPVNNPLTSGTGTNTSGQANLFTHTTTADFGYAQAFHTGTQVTAVWDTARTSTTSAAVHFDPSVQSTGTVTATQPLLNGFGRLINERYIRMAIITGHAVDAAFLQTLITDITAVEDDYWELVFARGNVSVQQQAVNLAQTLYDDNKKQVEIGTLAPLEIVRAEAQLATAQQGLITAQTVQLQDQALFMSVITKVPTAAELRNVEIVPTDTAENPPLMENIPLADAVAEALANRPDVAEGKFTVQGDDLNVKATRNGLLPSLALSAFATGVGLGGNQVPHPTSTPPIPFVAGGFPTAASELFQGSYPEFEAQLALSLPIRNRVASADSARAQLTQRQDQAKLQQLDNTVEVDVQNAMIVLQQDRAALIAAQKTTVLQKETLDADQRRLELGASTIFVVVTDQQALSVAASAEVRAMANLAEARINFERAMGRTLTANRITVADAKSGTIQKDTLIPGTKMTGELIGLKNDSNAVENPSR